MEMYLAAQAWKKNEVSKYKQGQECRKECCFLNNVLKFTYEFH